MGLISVRKDVDGDVHDASDHNDKFSLIADTINGNIGLENLANPYSVMTWRSFAQNNLHHVPYQPVDAPGGFAQPVIFGYYPLAVDDSSKVSILKFNSNYLDLPSEVDGAFNVITNSHRKADRDYVFLGANISVIADNVGPSPPTEYLMIFQWASASNGPYVNMGIMPFQRNVNFTSIAYDPGAASVTTRLLRSGRYFRIVVQNNESPSFSCGPPSLSVEVFLKAELAA